MKVTKLCAILSALAIATTTVYAQDQSANNQLNATDTGVLASVAALDKNEILLGIIAANKKPSAGVNDLAKMMIDQHGSNLTQIIEMASNSKISSLKGGSAEEIKTQGIKEMMTLGALKGDQFDKAYVDAMVKGHEAALNLIDTKLLKTAKSEEVKKFLTDTRIVVAQHLEHAKELQRSMQS